MLTKYTLRRERAAYQLWRYFADWHPNTTSPDSSIFWFELSDYVRSSYNRVVSAMTASAFYVVKWKVGPDSGMSLDYDDWQLPSNATWQKMYKPVADFKRSFQAITNQETHGHIVA